MSYHIHETEAIVLASRNVGEADKIIRFYTKDFGTIAVIAKGVRLEKSKLRGSLDMCMHTRIAFVVGKDMYRLTDAYALDVYPLIGKEGPRFDALSAIARFVIGIASGEEPDAGLWTLLSATLVRVGSGVFGPGHVLPTLYAFQAKALVHLGYMPEGQPRVVSELLRSGDIVPAVSLAELRKSEVREFFERIYFYALKEMRTPEDFASRQWAV